MLRRGGYKMRTQSYYNINIISRFTSPDELSRLIRDYESVRKDGPKGNKVNLRGHILEQVIENFDEFKDCYEAVKSPTVNNLPGKPSNTYGNKKTNTTARKTVTIQGFVSIEVNGDIVTIYR